MSDQNKRGRGSSAGSRSNTSNPLARAISISDLRPEHLDTNRRVTRASRQDSNRPLVEYSDDIGSSRKIKRAISSNLLLPIKSASDQEQTSSATSTPIGSSHPQVALDLFSQLLQANASHQTLIPNATKDQSATKVPFTNPLSASITSVCSNQRSISPRATINITPSGSKDNSLAKPDNNTSISSVVAISSSDSSSNSGTSLNRTARRPTRNILKQVSQFALTGIKKTTNDQLNSLIAGSNSNTNLSQSSPSVSFVNTPPEASTSGVTQAISQSLSDSIARLVGQNNQNEEIEDLITPNQSDLESNQLVNRKSIHSSQASDLNVSKIYIPFTEIPNELCHIQDIVNDNDEVSQLVTVSRESANQNNNELNTAETAEENIVTQQPIIQKDQQDMPNQILTLIQTLIPQNIKKKTSFDFQPTSIIRKLTPQNIKEKPTVKL